MTSEPFRLPSARTSAGEVALSAPGGAALYIGALLGPGLLLVPGLAAAAAGPASIVAWLGLLGLSGRARGSGGTRPRRSCSRSSAGRPSPRSPGGSATPRASFRG